MRQRRSSALFLALSLAACAAQEGQGKPAGDQPVSEKPADPPPEPAAADDLTIAVASVQLIQDCPDPEGEAAAAPAAGIAPAAEAMPAQDLAPGASAKRMAGGGAFHQPCTQSAVQLSLTNTGKRDHAVRIEAIRLVDAAEGGPTYGAVASRRPSLWSDAGAYQAWDERIAAGATQKVSYRLGEPDWDAVQSAISGSADANIYSHLFVLEIDVTVDGERKTVRSPGFVREQVHMIAT